MASLNDRRNKDDGSLGVVGRVKVSHLYEASAGLRQRHPGNCVVDLVTSWSVPRPSKFFSVPNLGQP
jgi:hypothetical protein